MKRLSNDTTSPTSAFAASLFGTAAGSWGAGIAAKLYLHHDRFRILAGVGGGEFNYNFFGVGTDTGENGLEIPLSQRSRGFLVEFKVRVFDHWYLGPRYHLITNRISLNSDTLDPSDLPIPLPSDLRFQTAALGVRVQRDSSDDPFYPRKGSLIDLTADFFDPAVGAQRNYQTVTTSYNKYLSAGAKNVFAIRGSVCGVSDRTPFFDVCLLGAAKDVRGYQIGQFRDDRMLVGQAEYRRELFWRLGVVAFAGAGAVGKTFSQFGNAEPGGGFGARFVLAPKNHLNLRADYAWGDNSKAFYVSLGEAF
jgi:outer membrane protein assembly factor BamA